MHCNATSLLKVKALQLSKSKDGEKKKERKKERGPNDVNNNGQLHTAMPEFLKVGILGSRIPDIILEKF